MLCPLYDVMDRPGVGLICLDVTRASLPYICFKVLTGSTFPLAPESVWSRRAHWYESNSGSLMASVVNTSSRTFLVSWKHISLVSSEWKDLCMLCHHQTHTLAPAVFRLHTTSSWLWFSSSVCCGSAAVSGSGLVWPDINLPSDLFFNACGKCLRKLDTGEGHGSHHSICSVTAS